MILSCVKRPDDDGENELILRVYETTGKATEARLSLEGCTQVWRSDVTEAKGEALPCSAETVELLLSPYEIMTLRIAR